MGKIMATKSKNLVWRVIKRVLLYYSVLVGTILIIGGFWTARSGKEIVSNVIFLPVVIFLWLTLIEKRKKKA